MNLIDPDRLSQIIESKSAEPDEVERLARFARAHVSASDDLSPKQRRIRDYVVQFRAERDYSPTLQEIGDALGVCKVTVFEHVAAIIRKGHMRRDGVNKARNLVPVCP